VVKDHRCPATVIKFLKFQKFESQTTHLSAFDVHLFEAKRIYLQAKLSALRPDNFLLVFTKGLFRPAAGASD
jgi:hypothetical protein